MANSSTTATALPVHLCQEHHERRRHSIRRVIDASGRLRNSWPRARDQPRIHVSAVLRRDHRYLFARDRRQRHLQRLSRPAGVSRGRALRHALLRHVPCAHDLRRAERQYRRHEGHDPQDSPRQRAAQRAAGDSASGRHEWRDRARPHLRHFRPQQSAFHDFSEILYPQDHRNCTTCHEETDADTPEASNYRITVNSAAVWRLS